MIRGISLRQLALLLFGPMLVEGINTVISTWMLLEASRSMGREPRELMYIAMVGSATYGLSAQITGRWVTARVAPPLMIAAIFGLGLAGLIAFGVNTFPAFLIAAAVTGISTGHYYVPFQINMSHVQPFRTLAFSVAFYNIAWGIGVSFGPLIGGSLRLSPVWILLTSIGVMIAVHTVIGLLAATAPPPVREEAAAPDFASTPRHRRLGLICMFAVAVIVRGLFATIWPDLGKQNHWTDAQMGIGLLLFFAPIPLLALPLACMRHTLHQPWVMLGSMALGLIGFALLPLATAWPIALPCIIAVGIMESCVVFNVIYYMNSDPLTRSRSVGTFETLIGISNIIGPLCLGLLAWDSAASWRPYAFGCVLLAAVIVFVAIDLVRHGAIKDKGSGFRKNRLEPEP